MPEISKHHLIGVILPGRFTESLIKRPTKNMEELRNRATKFMQIVEHIDYHKSHQSEGANKGKERKKIEATDPCQVGLSNSEKIRVPNFLITHLLPSRGDESWTRHCRPS